MFLTAVVVVVVAILVLSTLNAPARRARGNFDSADALILQAESSMLHGRLDEAFGFYQRAINPARASGSGLLEAEAYYGMARIHIKRNDKKSARRALDQALANRGSWDTYKPNFAALIERTAKELDDNSAS